MKYGCHNKERIQGYFTQHGLRNAGLKVGVWLNDVMSTPCKYDKRATDPKCEGCVK